LRGIAAMHGSSDPAARAGMLVIAMEMELPMQSHPVQWQGPVEGQASRAAARYGAVPKPWVTNGNSRNDASIGISSDTGHASHPAAEPGGTAMSPDTKTYPYATADSQDGNAPSNDDEACGVILCCVKSPPA